MEKNTVTVERIDFLSLDKKQAISAEGIVFNVGDTVYHEGAPDEESAIIKFFEVDSSTLDVVAHTTLGTARIVFLYKK